MNDYIQVPLCTSARHQSGGNNNLQKRNLCSRYTLMEYMCTAGAQIIINATKCMSIKAYAHMHMRP